jgi:aminoglycoside phosphotransferase family enzyme/predicted kinase
MGRASSHELSAAQQARAVAALRRALGAQLIETHISYVLLARRHAWKIKKAVSLGFLDFGTLQRREHFCREELRLNRRTAPALYLGVSPLTGTPEAPQVDGDGPVIDWVLHMRAFDQDGLWDRMARAGTLRAPHIDAGIAALCALHRDAAVAAPTDPAGQAAQVRAPLRDSLAALPALCPAAQDRSIVTELAAWEATAFPALQPLFGERARSGRVRECHGDLHLGNITQFEGRTTLFDGLEFDAALRWTDVMSDLAFVSMDLSAHGLPRLAQRWINGHVECTGDADGLRVLRYYQVHRALVRAKVAALRAAQQAARSMPRRETERSLRRYLEVARGYTLPSRPTLMLAHGFSGSGKTTLTQSLLEVCGAVRFRADVQRKRLFGLDALARSDAALKQHLYGPAATDATHARLRELAALALQGGSHVILDATFLQHAQRQQARELAGRLGVATLILDFRADAALLRRRVRERAARGDDASEADLAVLAQQRATAQPLSEDERAMALSIDVAAATGPVPPDDFWAPVLQRLAQAAH